MNFNIYLDQATDEKLRKLARRKRVTRNALIRNAVQELVRREEQPVEWSPEVLDWRGDPAMQPFESFRKDLGQAAADPLA